MHLASIVFPVNELLQWFAAWWIGRSFQVLPRNTQRRSSLRLLTSVQHVPSAFTAYRSGYAPVRARVVIHV
jgi:hypothetical protein